MINYQLPVVSEAQPRPWISGNLEYAVFHEGRRQTKVTDAKTGLSTYR